ncbi:uncharacterized protein LOC128724642 [Anopheles nili]|uniref:uncharacterized protein LOC128724642 n=1 Tax=Anopheles nili TaxID=185578 RepID=UPI00237BF0C6|nr:uncharacterized protein LOC128724642 [Anopheles nili]
MNGTLKVFAIALVLLVGESVSAPQGDIHSEYPNGAFDDRVPNNDNNQKFKEYAEYLTRFDEWVTGKKVPIPADPTTDALHQDLPPNAPSFGSTRIARNPIGFDGHATADEHPVFKREDKPSADALISQDKDFGGHIEDKVPETSTSSDPAYGDFIKELKRFDAWIVGHEVTIPQNTTADQVWNSNEAKDH